MSKRILITGGAGFIGSHLCQKLVDQGHNVLCLDNCFTGSKDNIQNLLNYRNFEFIRHDITQPILLEVDEIYNLACPASPIHYQHNPVKTIKTNVIGTLNMLGLAKRVNAKILQASTSEVYGDPSIHPQVEEYWGNVNPIGPRACYDEGKRCAEALMFEYHRQNKIKIRIIRIFNTYGPNMSPNDGRVISNFIMQALRNEPITIFGTGEQTRSFQYVDDLINGMIKMMENNIDFIGPVNIGNPNEFTIKQLTKKIIELIPGCQSQIVYKPLPINDPKKRKPDITLAQEKLDWFPRIDLDDGLKKTIEYFRTKTI